MTVEVGAAAQSKPCDCSNTDVQEEVAGCLPCPVEPKHTTVTVALFGDSVSLCSNIFCGASHIELAHFGTTFSLFRSWPGFSRIGGAINVFQNWILTLEYFNFPFNGNIKPRKQGCVVFMIIF